ncbi:putative laccase-9 isoform X3 [Quercus robur]|uniref:putative laccase-9 isoform X3 n=1 Tax=Quercus robur TaxID=38942 RepID=UPI0021629E86|nr:putative laccase-9 isoform X3 [Quercus robur]XP_050268550.1 putative laccase-9 isoform X3 [Quercus robur]
MNSKNKECLLNFIGFLFLVAQCLSMVEGEVHYYEFVLAEKNFTKLCNTTSKLVVNGSIPGPVIRVHKGDTVYVNVHNQGYYGVTIHWHGVKQPRNPWSDGPEYITQCPIEPGSNFTYEVIFSTEEGTLWWHAHSDWTRVYVHGAIVILPTIGTTYPFPKPDDENIIILGSLYSGNLTAELDYALIYGDDLPHSIGYTINGEPGDLGPCSKETTYRRVVDHGKTYLLRLVNSVVAANMFFAIAEHNLTIVGMDASYIKPITTSYVMIAAGQTMDILLTANQTLGHYYIAARQFWSQEVDLTNFDLFNVTAIIEYRGNYTIPLSPSFPSTLPNYKDSRAVIKFSKLLRSLASKDHPVNVPLNITTRMYITVSMAEIECKNTTCIATGEEIIIATSVNSISWSNPVPTDVLLAYYRNITGVYTMDFPDQPLNYFNFTADELPEALAMADLGSKVKVLNYNEAVEVVFQGTNILGAGYHPMHLHGHSFYVVGSGYGNYNNDTDPKKFNLVDPVAVNTFGVPKNGWLAIRFVANNPGVWFWHCHVDRHMTWGMAAVFIVKNGGTAETSIRKPPPHLPPCNVPLESRVQNNDGSDGKENQTIFI